MDLNKDNLEKNDKLIEHYINSMGQAYPDKDNNIKPIPDGVVDPERYLSAKWRIAWVLDKPRSKEGDERPMREYYYEKENFNEVEKGRHKYIIKMAYVTYGLLNNYMLQEQMPDYHDKNNPVVGNSTRSYVHMNIDKFPVIENTSDAADKKESKTDYEYWHPIYLFQLMVYDPQIVIFGNNIEHFEDDLNLNYSPVDRDYLPIVQRHAVKDGRLYVDAYSPACRRSYKDYTNCIVKFVQAHFAELKSEK